MRSVRSLAAFVAAALLMLTLPGAASATVSTISVYPNSQTITSGGTATWGWSWSGSGTYSPRFYYGDGTSRLYGAQANGGSGSAFKTFVVCSSTTYTQRIQVSTSQASATTRVNATGACR